MKIKISIIIPTYKPQDYLWKCLDSVIAQTFPKEQYDVVIVLNGCKEPYYSKIKDYLDAHSVVQVKYIQVDEGGVSNARNIGIDEAQGEYITFIDDDDYVSPSYLEELYQKSSVDTVGLSYTLSFDDDNLSVNKVNRITKNYNRLYGKGKQPFYEARSYFSGPCMKLIHRDIIRNYRFERNLRVGEDSTFMFVISDKIKYIDLTSQKAVYYRRWRQGSAITSKRSFIERFKSNTLQLAIYTKTYISGIRHYNFMFYLTRCVGCVRGIFG